MAASEGDVIKVVVNQRQNNQLIQNVFWYQVVAMTGLTGNYLEIVRDWMIDEVISVVRVIQNQALTYQSMFIQNVTNQVDFLEYAWPVPLAGGQSGDVMPPNVTLTFRLIRETLATRNGYKRFAGVSESSQNNGISQLPSAAVTAVQDALAADIQPAPSIVPLFAPVIVRRGSDGTILAVNNVGACDFRVVGTQNTRKIGRGA